MYVTDDNLSFSFFLLKIPQNRFKKIFSIFCVFAVLIVFSIIFHDFEDENIGCIIYSLINDLIPFPHSEALRSGDLTHKPHHYLL